MANPDVDVQAAIEAVEHRIATHLRAAQAYAEQAVASPRWRALCQRYAVQALLTHGRAKGGGHYPWKAPMRVAARAAQVMQTAPEALPSEVPVAVVDRLLDEASSASPVRLTIKRQTSGPHFKPDLHAERNPLLAVAPLAWDGETVDGDEQQREYRGPRWYDTVEVPAVVAAVIYASWTHYSPKFWVHELVDEHDIATQVDRAIRFGLHQHGPELTVSRDVAPELELEQRVLRSTMSLSVVLTTDRTAFATAASTPLSSDESLIAHMESYVLSELRRAAKNDRTPIRIQIRQVRD